MLIPSNIWKIAAMISSCTAACCTSGYGENNPTSCQGAALYSNAQNVPTTRNRAMVRRPASMARSGLPSPWWRPTRVVAAMPMPQAVMKLIDISRRATWLAASATSPSQPMMIVITRKAPTSMKNWKPIGRPTRTMSFNRDQRTAAATRAAPNSLYRGRPWTTATKHPSMNRLLSPVASPAPSTPIAGIGPIPKIRA